MFTRKFMVLALLVCCRFVSRTQRTRRASTDCITKRCNIFLNFREHPPPPPFPPPPREGKGRVCTRGSSACWPCLCVGFVSRTQRTRRANTSGKSTLLLPPCTPFSLLSLPRLLANAGGECSPAEVARVGPACVLGSSPEHNAQEEPARGGQYPPTTGTVRTSPTYAVNTRPSAHRERGGEGQGVHPRK